jgi:hypothetical protein
VLIGIDIADTAAGAIAGYSLWFNSQKSSSGASYKSFLWSPKLALNRTFLSFQKRKCTPERLRHRELSLDADVLGDLKTKNIYVHSLVWASFGVNNATQESANLTLASFSYR